MPKRHLSSKFIQNLKPQGKRVDFYDQHKIDPETHELKRKGVKGLILRITKAGNKYFYFNYWFDGNSKRYKIGSYPNIGLSKAREEARKKASIVNEGIDPLAEKNKRKQKPDPQTFGELADEFKDKHLPTLRESTRKEYERIIDIELIPKLGKYPINEISKNQIVSLLDDKAYKNDSPTMANRIRARLSKVYSFGMERGLADSNPVQATSTYKSGETKRDRFYEQDEIQELWNFFEQLEQPTKSVLKMLLVTGQRKTETMKMRWDDIHSDVWTIPAELAKNKKPHDVPLSDMALEIINQIRPITGETDFVFCSPKKENLPMGWLTRARRNIQRQSSVSDFRPHDLRRTVATYMAKLQVDRTVLGKILNHKGLSGDSQVTAIYDRHSYMKEKRQAMNRWSHKLEQIIEGTETKVAGKIG